MSKRIKGNLCRMKDGKYGQCEPRGLTLASKGADTRNVALAGRMSQAIAQKIDSQAEFKAALKTEKGVHTVTVFAGRSIPLGKVVIGTRNDGSIKLAYTGRLMQHVRSYETQKLKGLEGLGRGASVVHRRGQSKAGWQASEYTRAQKSNARKQVQMASARVVALSLSRLAKRVAKANRGLRRGVEKKPVDLLSLLYSEQRAAVGPSLRAARLILEAKKKLRGNLCVNTGQGSGGGFTACSTGATATHTSAMSALHGALRAGDADALRKAARELVDKGYQGRITIVPNAATLDPHYLAGANAVALVRIASVYKSLIEKSERAEDRRIALERSRSVLGRPFMGDPETFPLSGGDTLVPFKEGSVSPEVTEMQRMAVAKRGGKKQVLASGWETLEQSEARIAGNAHESAALFNSAGDQILAKRGGKHTVSFNYRELQVMEGGVMTHNHPSALGLSGQDLHLAVSLNLAQVRAVTELFDADGKSVGRITYAFTRPEKGWLDGATGSAGDLWRGYRLTGSSGSFLVAGEVPPGVREMAEHIRGRQARHLKTWRKSFDLGTKEMGALGLDAAIVGVIKVNQRAAADAGLADSFSYKIEGSVLGRAAKDLYPAGQKPSKRRKRGVSALGLDKAVKRAIDIFQGVEKPTVDYFAQQRSDDKQLAGRVSGFSLGGKTRFRRVLFDTKNWHKGIAYLLRKEGAKSGGIALMRHPDRPEILFPVNPNNLDKPTRYEGRLFKVVDGDIVPA